MPTLRTPEQQKCINTLISKQGLTASRKDIIAGASDGRTESVRELHFDEARDLIKYLKDNDPRELAADVMRKKIFAMAYEYKGLPRSAPDEDKKKVQASLKRWLLQYGYLHKPLNNYNYEELPKLVSQFQQVLKSLLIEL